jgi:Kef-type K+ transport system membrane component KefB
LTLGIIYSPHTLIAYPIITNLKIAQQEAVNVAVGGTIVTSILTLTGLSIAQALSQGNLNSWLWIKLLILFPIAIIIYAWLVSFISKSLLTQQNQNLTFQFVFILTCLFSAASLTLALGLDSIVGAFMAGLTLNPVIARNSQIMQQLNFVSNSIIIPMFLISVGVLCNPQILFQHPENLVISIAVIIGAVGAKFLAAWITGSIDRYSWAEIMVMFGLTMSRAALVLVIALFGKNAGLFNEGIFNAIVLYIIVTCLTGPLITNSFAKQIAISKLI